MSAQHDEDLVLAQLRRLPGAERKRLLSEFTARVAQALGELDRAPSDHEPVQVVQQTWGTISLAPRALRWVAEDHELEYPE